MPGGSADDILAGTQNEMIQHEKLMSYKLIQVLV